MWQCRPFLFCFKLSLFQLCFFFCFLFLHVAHFLVEAQSWQVGFVGGGVGSLGLLQCYIQPEYQKGKLFFVLALYFHILKKKE